MKMSEGWEILGILLIKDFEIFIQVLLSGFRRMLEAGNYASWVLGEGGCGKNPGTATSIKANLGSFALIICLGLWKCLEMGLNLEDHVHCLELPVSMEKDL